MSYNESLNNNSNYPLMTQSEWDNAPWNQRDPEPVEVEVQVTIVLTKNIKLPVTDYIVEPGGIDEDGVPMSQLYVFDDCDFHQALKDNVTLPHQLADLMEGCKLTKYDVADCKGWELEEVEISEI